MPLSESKKRANERWDKKNKERKNYINKKSIAKNFIGIAEYDDLQILKRHINKQKKGVYYMENIVSLKKVECMEILEDYLEECVFDKVTHIKKYAFDKVTHTKRCAFDIITHTKRVVKICKKIIKSLNLSIDEHTRKIIYRAAIFHDIAKLTEDSELKNHNELVEEPLDIYFESDDDLEMITSIIKYHKGEFEPVEDFAIAAAVLRMADKIDRFNKGKEDANEKYEKNLKKIEKYFKNHKLKNFEEIKRACDEVKDDIVEDKE